MSAYIELLLKKIGMNPLWDYLGYDENGDLWINDICVHELVKKYGSPLEISDLTILKKRGLSWMALTQEVAKEIGFTGGFNYFYASKANMSLPYTLAAYRAGWHIETSSVQDLENLLILYEKGQIDLNKEIICNGYKISGDSLHLTDKYAQRIVEFHNKGFNITPILDSGEVDYFTNLNLKRSMSVGLRMKFGKVENDLELENLVSRHGMGWGEVLESAEKINNSKMLCLSTFHCMVAAAETIEIEQFVNSLLFGARKYFTLKQKYSSLKYFDIGGGIPPMISQYNYRQFLDYFLSGLTDLSLEFGLEAPTVIFELGSFLTEESGFLVHTILQKKLTGASDKNKAEVWALLDGGLMSELPDMFIQNKSFSVFAGSSANCEVERVIFGDLTCDTDGRYPRKNTREEFVLLPSTEGKQIVVFAGTGSYQKMLGGFGGAHHCGILESAKVIVEDFSGETKVHFVEAQNNKTVSDLLGYSSDLLNDLSLDKTDQDMVYRQGESSVI